MRRRLPKTRFQRGTIIVLVAVSIPVMLAFAALTVDVGMLYSARADLQRAADAAALAGATAFLEDAGITGNEPDLALLIASRTKEAALRNPTLGKSTSIEPGDLVFGQHDYDHPSAPLGSVAPWNAVQVTLRRTPGSANGPVPYFFAGIFKRFRGGVTASARAAVNDRMAGYQLSRDLDWDFIPFAIHQDIYENMIHNGPDAYSYDNGVHPTPDGVREIRLYPWRWKDLATDLHMVDSDGAGNFGTLNVGIGDQGTSSLNSQITNGVTASQLETTFGTSTLEFYDEAGTPQTYTCGGNPGLSGGLASAVEARIGDVVGFFLHKGFIDSGNGANAVYEVTGIRFGRIVAARLTGNPNERTIIIQPVAREDGHVIVDDAAPPTHGYMGRVMLVQ